MLYRGEDLKAHHERDGQILPKGSTVEVVPRFDGSWRFDGTFVCGPSEANAARAQQIESGKWDSCFVSTSRSWDRAKHFATSGNFDEGVIYWIDESLFAQYGVVLQEFCDPLYPHEQEVSIRAADGGPIPLGVVVKVEFVSPG